MQDFDKPREKPLTQEQWEAMERTMGSNGKSNAKSNGISRKSGRVLTCGCVRGDTADALHASPVGRQKQNAPEAPGLRTRQSHSALNAMHPSRRECQRNPIYPRYPGCARPNGPSVRAMTAVWTWVMTQSESADLRFE
jgi:hypothetical protein